MGAHPTPRRAPVLKRGLELCGQWARVGWATRINQGRPDASPHHASPTGMPLIYWFSRRMTLWGSISFNLAVFINIIIAFFYPYMEGASTGQESGWAGRGRAAHRSPPQGQAEPWGQLVSEGTRCREGRSALCTAFCAPHPILGSHRCGPVGQTGSLTSRDRANACTHPWARDQIRWQQLERLPCLRPRGAGVMGGPKTR